MTGILALDLATQTGWAFDDPARQLDMPMPIYGSARMGDRHADVDDKALALFHWIHRKIEELRPQYLIFEAPLLTRTDNVDLVQLLFGLAQVAAIVAKMHDVTPYKVIGITAIRIFTGVGKFEGKTRDERSRAKKRAVIEACRRHGWDPPDHNAADALAVLYFAQSILERGRVERTAGPLFGGKAA